VKGKSKSKSKKCDNRFWFELLRQRVAVKYYTELTEEERASLDLESKVDYIFRED
jgi:hypothetical protein